ncbi:MULTISPECIES: response regulator transcription factor [Clostridium]|uniref:response regulator transcription factor n=1 Tax=Clostridium TaxID=1485 RepID=UPI00082704BF|nr:MULTISPECIES: response regulator transcription factor [Clostridium]PJI08481.1 DNA-binding response regulator [Clostridium sp. CT7]
MKKILIIEDDLKLRKYIKDFLISYNYEVKLIENFDSVEEEVLSTSPDLILLDINLPKFNGFYFLKNIRKKISTPVIIISARNTEQEQIRGIDLGADDYITKPFGIELLIAKINAIFRRIDSSVSNIIKLKDIELMCDSISLKINDKVIELSRNEYKLLKVFMTNYSKVVSREELLEELWDETSFVDDNTLTVNITRLKKRLKEIGANVSIVTKRGIGYVLQ